MTETRPISGIKVGDRVRQDLGDIDSLAESITNNGGLLQPIVIRSDGTLIAGYRRFMACKAIKRDHIEVYVRNDIDSVVERLIAERDENTCRKDPTPSEAVALGERLEELERPKAEARKAEAGKANLPTSGGHLPPLTPKGETRERVGAAVGMSGTKYRKAKTVKRAADSGDPEAVKAKEEMDKTGKVEGAYRTVTKKPKPPPKPFDVTSQRNRQVANKAKERLHGAMGQLNGIGRALNEMKVEQVTATATAADIAGWITQLEKTDSVLRSVRKRLEEVTK